LKIIQAEFVAGATAPAQFPRESLPEVAFAGRSNVGKSTLINGLLKRRGLARTSSTPGRTQQINFFRINQKFLFVDLPGYGYARVSQAVKDSWMDLIRSYLKQRERLVQVILIVDTRIGPTPLDLQLLEWLQFNRLPFIVVSTKADKLSKGELHKSIRHAESLSQGARVVPYSAVNNLGHEQLWSILIPLLEKHPAA
jgi:GTP-binding protein